MQLPHHSMIPLLLHLHLLLLLLKAMVILFLAFLNFKSLVEEAKIFIISIITVSVTAKQMLIFFLLP
jgi:hypothetical protein